MRKLVVLVVLACLVSPVFGGGAQEPVDPAEQFPTRPVEVIVPWAPGGATDTVTRALMSVMGNHFSQPMAVINRPGGGGTVGTTHALNQRPDGYTVLVNSWGAFITQPALSRLEYGPDDYEVVMQLNHEPRILVGHPSVPYNDIREMVEYAEQNPTAVHVGIAAVGATDHFAMLELELEYGIELTITPQGGGGPARTAVLGHHTDVAALVASEAGPLIEAGELKPLGVMGPARYAPLPDIPTTAEIGIPVESGVANHVYVPAGVPAERVRIIHDAFKNAMEDEGFLALAGRLALDPGYADGAESRATLDRFRALYTRIADEMGMRE